MRKCLIIITIMLFVLSLAACYTVKSTSKANNNYISQTTLTDREKMFISNVSNEYFIFDYKVDNKINRVDVWIDRYESGKKISSIGKLSMGLSKAEKGILFVSVNELDGMKQDWTIAINSGGSTYTTKSHQEYTAGENSHFSKMWMPNTLKTISVDDKEITLGYICYKDQSKGTSMRLLTDLFCSNPDENLKEIENYNLVYLLKCKFYSNSPIRK